MEGIQIRLKKIIGDENMTAGIFAERIGVLPSALSHVLSGRNKPGADFLEKLLRAIPYINANWLLTGEGLPYLPASNMPEFSPDSIEPETKKPQEEAPKWVPKPAVSEKKLSRVILIYDDHSFEEFRKDV